MSAKSASSLDKLIPYEFFPFALYTPNRPVYDRYTKYRTLGHAKSALKGLYGRTKEGAKFYKFDFEKEEWEEYVE